MRAIYLVEEQSNPSTDYFVLPLVSTLQVEVIRCAFADLPVERDLESALVIFIRYIPATWAKLVSGMRHRLAGLIFFMDDDVLDLNASSGMPLRYRYKLFTLAASKKSWLMRNNAELWVSTKYLYDKYLKWQPRLILPTPIKDAVNKCRFFYHATASHDAEIRWLRSIVAEVMSRRNDLVFEIVGGERVYRLYRDIPGVNVIHPMKWDAYNAFLGLAGRDIGLVPQLKLPFNSARSYTKFFDITRCGAAGIYSSTSACSEIIEDGVDGLIVEMDQKHWVEAILRLAGDDVLRQKIIENSKRKLVVLTDDAQRENQELLVRR